MNKHTPGPWQFHSLSGTVFHDESSNGYICHVIDGEFREANARLIAAAPELLEALKNLYPLVRLRYGNLDTDVNELLRLAEVAIAKAEGAQ